MVYTAIDHFRKNQKHKVLTELDNVVYQLEAYTEDAIDKLSHDEIIRAILIRRKINTNTIFPYLLYLAAINAGSIKLF